MYHLSIQHMKRRAKLLSGSLCANIYYIYTNVYISSGLHGFIMENYSTIYPQVEDASESLTQNVIVLLNSNKEKYF